MYAVAAKLAQECTVQLAYAIGVAEPVSVLIDTNGTGVVPDAAISRAVEKSYDLTPSGIISFLQLRRPVFQKTASYGHFGRNEPNFLWEKINKATELAKACN
jgi:S-adenosylmethionine synthetase